MSQGGEDQDGIVPATRINLQSLQLSLGKEKPELFHCSTGHFHHSLSRLESVD